MIIVIENPEMVKDFIGYIKRESAHAINRLQGRRKKTIWAAGYDSPIILDWEKVVDRIVYLYTNPQQANLVEKIDDYPNLSSWNAFLNGGEEISRPRVPRSAIAALPRRQVGLKEQEKIASELLKQGQGLNHLLLEPDAWMDCFSETRDADPEEIQQHIMEKVRNKENLLSEKRKRPVLGKHALKLSRMTVLYTPKKHGKRMICLSGSKDYRSTFIYWYRQLCAKGVKALEQWGIGDWRASLPPGLFSPGGKMLSYLNPIFVPVVGENLA